MRHLPWIVLGVVLGFLLGGVGPRRDAAAAEEEIAALRADLAAAKRKSSRRGMFGAPVPALDGLRAERADAEADADDPLQDDGEEGRAERVVVGDAAAGAEGSAAQDARRSFDLAVDAQALRARQSRQALVEQAGLDADGQQALDDLVLNMNHRLADHADELVDLVLSEEEPTSSELLGVSHDVTGILYEAQTRLEELVGDDALGEVDPEASQVWNHLDLETLRPAMERAEKNGLLGGAGAP